MLLYPQIICQTFSAFWLRKAFSSGFIRRQLCSDNETQCGGHVCPQHNMNAEKLLSLPASSAWIGRSMNSMLIVFITILKLKCTWSGYHSLKIYYLINP